ncbi:hypothetical protein ACHOLT_18565 [Desulfitobacterium sp. Sab5]|uniref:hypothetical protein n=1 Tax=Desulfitobacterium nosdiversum TaxID=3375356 RepID=UPI003CED8252
MDLATGLSYGYFLMCLILGWMATAILKDEVLIKQSSSPAKRFLFRLGIALVLAEGFRVFLSFILGPFLDELVNRSIQSFIGF